MRAAIYARMSTDKQSDDGPDSRVSHFLDILAEMVAKDVLAQIQAEAAGDRQDGGE